MDSAELGDRAIRCRLALAGTRFERVEWVAETGSTNSDLLARAAAGEHEGTVRVAEHQTAGKGTRGRTWVDTPGAQLMVSVLLRPALSPARLGHLTMAWSLAAAEACAEVAGVTPGLKWPNDLFDPAGERKVAGVLAESQLGPDGRVDAVVIGMGMNCNGGVPNGLAVPGVSLAELSGRPVDRVALLVALLAAFERLYGEVGGPAIPQAYRQRSVTIGRRVRVELAGEQRLGLATGITEDGLLLVELDARPGEVGGGAVAFSAGDVVHVRTTD